jgi:putative glutamine amidotransferase
VHDVTVLDPGYRDGLGVDRFPANSFHNQGVTIATLGRALRPIATSDAGVVEALYHEHLPILGFQWHPERESPDPVTGSKLFLRWLDLCESRSRGKQGLVAFGA